MSVTVERSVRLTDDGDDAVITVSALCGVAPGGTGSAWNLEGTQVHATNDDLRAFGLALVALADEYDAAAGADA